jgi:hypothetical protein
LHNKLLFILILIGQDIFAQEFVVDTIVFTETIDKRYHSNIPFVKNPSGKKEKISDKINEQIKDRFMFESFDPSKNKEFRWYDVDFKSEIIANILLISFNGEYYGAYPNMVQDNLYFDLKTGNEIQEETLDYHLLFSKQGYFDFLDKYWSQGCEKEFKEAIKCADAEPYCSQFDIIFRSDNDITLKKGLITFALINDCFPHVVQACSPLFEIQIPIKDLKPYLSSFGIFTLFESKYLAKTTLEKYLFFKDNQSKIPFTYFIQGKINGKYRFNMAFEINKKSKIAEGFYYYQKKKVSILLNGSYDDKTILLTESVKNKKTGQFKFQLKGTDDSIYSKWSIFSGKWTGIDQHDQEIEIIDIREKK